MMMMMMMMVVVVVVLKSVFLTAHKNKLSNYLMNCEIVNQKS